MVRSPILRSKILVISYRILIIINIKMSRNKIMHLDFRRFITDSEGSNMIRLPLYEFVPTQTNHHDSSVLLHQHTTLSHEVAISRFFRPSY
jgi:hypothetical protein